MMRITVLDGKAEQRLMVEGTLSVLYLPELESTWNQARQEAGSRPIVIDLSGVTRIDANAEAALTTMIADGARLTARGPYYGYVVEQLMKAARKARARRHGQNGDGARDSSSAKESTERAGRPRS
jgi:ABC-type transporter Mla MlaB component